MPISSRAKAGIPLAEARHGWTALYTDAVAALDKAKKVTELSGLLTGLGLLIGLVAAWYGGVRGGKQPGQQHSCALQVQRVVTRSRCVLRTGRRS